MHTFKFLLVQVDDHGIQKQLGAPLREMMLGIQARCNKVQIQGDIQVQVEDGNPVMTTASPVYFGAIWAARRTGKVQQSGVQGRLLPEVQLGIVYGVHPPAASSASLLHRSMRRRLRIR